MKKLYCLIILLTLGNFSYSQNSAIELVEFNVLYRGYDNIVKIAFQDSSDTVIELAGTNVEISKKDDFIYIVKAGNGILAELFLIRKSESSSDTIYKKQFSLNFTPDPTIYWGPNMSGTKANREEDRLFAKYPGHIPLNATHKIRKWKIIYGEKEISGIGTLHTKAKEFLNTLPENSTVIIECEVIMPSSSVKRIYGIWQIE